MLIAGNWKMYKTAEESADFCRALRGRLEGLDGVDVAVAPYTGACRGRGRTGRHESRSPPRTSIGEAKARTPARSRRRVLRELGVYGAIVGHSERRQYFGETDEAVALRARAALDAGLWVIVCVGELEEERERGETEAVLRRQVSVLEADEDLVVSYEPVWAIGTGKVATPDQAQEAHAFIRSLIDVPVLYGGSVKPENAAGLLEQPDVAGALVGGASLEVESFAAICEAAAAVTV